MLKSRPDDEALTGEAREVLVARAIAADIATDDGRRERERALFELMVRGQTEPRIYGEAVRACIAERQAEATRLAGKRLDRLDKRVRALREDLAHIGKTDPGAPPADVPLTPDAAEPCASLPAAS